MVNSFTQSKRESGVLGILGELQFSIGLSYSKGIYYGGLGEEVPSRGSKLCKGFQVEMCSQYFRNKKEVHMFGAEWMKLQDIRLGNKELYHLGFFVGFHISLSNISSSLCNSRKDFMTNHFWSTKGAQSPWLPGCEEVLVEGLGRMDALKELFPPLCSLLRATSTSKGNCYHIRGSGHSSFLIVFSVYSRMWASYSHIICMTTFSTFHLLGN